MNTRPKLSTRKKIGIVLIVAPIVLIILGTLLLGPVYSIPADQGTTVTDADLVRMTFLVYSGAISTALGALTIIPGLIIGITLLITRRTP